MPETKEVNPLREGLSSRAMPKPCAVVIFGATGDLTHRKLVPALYNLAADGELPPAVSVVGFARREKTDEKFRKELEEAARKFSRQTIVTICGRTLRRRSTITAVNSTSSRATSPSRSGWMNWTPSEEPAGIGSFIFRRAPTSSRSSWRTCGRVASIRHLRQLGARHRREAIRHRLAQRATAQ